MTAAEQVRESVSGLQGVEINGGDSAGAPNGSRVAKFTPPQGTHIVFSSGITQVGESRKEELSNKQDGNQGGKNEAQGKSPPAAESTAGALIELPPAAPISVRGRPTVLTLELLDQLCQLVALGFSRAQAAAHLGINRSIITRAAKKDPELQAALAQAEEVSELQPQLTIMAEARKNWRAAAWLLQFKAKHHRRIVTKEDEEMDREEHLEGIRRWNETVKVLADGELPQREPELKVKIRRGKR